MTSIINGTCSVIKNIEDDPFLFVNSFVESGYCSAMVACVGVHTTRPKTTSQKLFKTELTKSELRKRLSNLDKTFTLIGLLFAVSVLAIAISIQIIQMGVNEEIGGTIFLKNLIENLTLAGILLVVAIPEGLSTTVAVSLAYSTIEMFKRDRILVRDINSLE